MLTQSFPPMQVQQLLQMKKQQQAAAQQKAGQPQGQATVQQKVNLPTKTAVCFVQKYYYSIVILSSYCINCILYFPQIGTQQVTVQAAQPTQQAQQKVTYAATTQLQPGIKTQFFTSIAQPQKTTGTQIQVLHHRQSLS